MKQIIKIAFLVIITNVMYPTVQAQQRIQFNVNYNISTPLSTDFKDYVNRTSVRGGQASILYSFNNQIRAGLQGSFSNFYQKYGRQVYKTSDGADISAVLSNTLQTVPLLAKGEYSLSKIGFFQPYIGVGAGVNFINYDQFIGEFQYNRNFIKPTFSGDVGLMIPFKKDANYGFRISTSYNLVPFNEEGIHRLDSWNAQVGFTIPLK